MQKKQLMEKTIKKEELKIANALKMRDDKAELLRDQHMQRFNELERSLKKITSEKHMKGMKLLNHFDEKVRKIEEEKQVKLTKHQKALELKNKQIEETKNKADGNLMKRLDDV